MTREIRPIETDEDLSDAARIQLSAYPVSTATPTEMEEWLGRIRDLDDDSALWGLWEDGVQAGNMRLLDFELNFDGRFVPAGGIGGLAVDLPYKKRGVARDLVRFFLQSCREKDETLALLYPFRPDFYYRMGFGYGTKQHSYRFEPHSLPDSQPGQGSVSYLARGDAGALRACYDTYAAGQHGWCKLTGFELGGLVRNYLEKRRAVGYWEDGQLTGYLTFGSERANERSFVSNNLVLRHWVYNSRDALAGLCSFLYRQADQYEHIIYNTQEADFHHLFTDVRNGTGNMLPHAVAHETSIAGVGMMYRVVGMADFLINTRLFGEADINLVLEVEDTFFPDNAGHYNLAIRNGRPRLVEGPLDGITVRGNVADLSSALVGSADLGLLYKLGKVEVGPSEVEAVTQTLRTSQKPMCVTDF